LRIRKVPKAEIDLEQADFMVLWRAGEQSSVSQTRTETREQNVPPAADEAKAAGLSSP
jgi:hypothetical protein